MDYKKAGVDIEAGYRSVELMKEHVKKTMRPEVLGGLGGFSGAFSLTRKRIACGAKRLVRRLSGAIRFSQLSTCLQKQFAQTLFPPFIMRKIGYNNRQEVDL